MKRPTIVEVAAHAGVSKATVSLVLRGSDQIPEGTKSRVRESMVALGYVYNRRAAEMRSLRSKTLGLVVANMRNPYFAELTQAVAGRAYSNGFTLLLGCSDDEVSRQQEILRAMIEHRVDGIALLPATRTTSRDLESSLVQAELAHVLIARSVVGYGSNYVGPDNRVAGRLLGRHLGEKGARSVAFAGGVSGTAPRRDRIAGLVEGLELTGGRLSSDLPSARDALFEAQRELNGVLGGASTLPDAIVGYNDMYAFGVMNALRSRGLEPGRDVMVAGFDNVPEAATQHPGLTTVDGFPQRAGAEATELLLRTLGARRQSVRVRLSLNRSCESGCRRRCTKRSPAMESCEPRNAHASRRSD
ncbi:MAG: LacI family transcriptional regulator [Actinobacteria bacterium]|nr:LacI family transcriptional regulator [Actinomycetota bacterium]